MILKLVVAAACAFQLTTEQAIHADTVPEPEAILRTLKPEHPRLLIDAAEIREIRELIKRNEIAKRLCGKIKVSADKHLKEKPLEYELRDGRRLIYVSQDVLRRVEHLAFIYLITNDKKYVDRVWLELESASKFKDWNPSHFLDTAIMTNAFAIGLDWLWDVWTPEQRQVLQQAIIEKGLKPSLPVYAKRQGGWSNVNNNWNQVCNGGMGMGALAVAEVAPDLAGKIIHSAVESIPKAMRPYAPDGAGHEGVGYWSFGTRYNVMLMASLESALGTDFGLSQIEGFKESGDYQIYLSGTDRYAFDFGDCGRTKVSAPQHLWMARKYNISRYFWFRYNALSDGQGGDWRDLIWLNTNAANFPRESIPLDKYFSGVELVSMRDSWSSGDGFIFAAQGGYNGDSHRHLDLGSFILESEGVRWIVDSGKESQTYQRHKNHTPRNDFYRVRAEGHNTLVINPNKSADQDPRGRAKFTDFVSERSQAKATLDLTNAYKSDARRVTRSIELERGKYVTITDTIECKAPSEIWSFFHTEAQVKISADKRTAYFKQNEKILRMRLGLPENATLQLMAAKPLPSSPDPSVQRPDKKVRKVAIHLNGVEKTEIIIRFDFLSDLGEEG